MVGVERLGCMLNAIFPFKAFLLLFLFIVSMQPGSYTWPVQCNAGPSRCWGLLGPDGLVASKNFKLWALSVCRSLEFSEF